MEMRFRDVFQTINKEIMLITLISYVLFPILGLITFNLHVFDSIEQTIEDFDITDLIYLNLRDKEHIVKASENIVLVNIGKDRATIAKQLEFIQEYKPKVVALDSWFMGMKSATDDSILSTTLNKYNNIVLAGFLEKNTTEKHLDGDLNYTHSDLNYTRDIPSGYANFIAEKENTVRYFSPKELIGKDTVYSFALEILKKYNPTLFHKIAKRKKKTEYIRYSMNESGFLKFNTTDIFSKSADLNQLKDKIVLLGQLGDSLHINNQTVLEDINFTPLNHKLSGRSLPDMYGAYIHANILEMMLDHKMTKKAPNFLILIFSVIICYFHMVFFIRLYLQKPLWFHVGTKAIQLVSSIFIIGFALLLLSVFHLKINTGLILLPILLAAECIYFYDAFVKFLHRKFPRIDSIFFHAKH